MSVHPYIVMIVLILFVVNTGCGNSAGPSADAERLVAAGKTSPNTKPAVNAAREKEAVQENPAQQKVAKEEQAAQEKAAAESYVRIMVDVELQGRLALVDETVTITIVTKFPDGKDRFRFQENEWVLDFGENKEMFSKAKGLNGKTVLVKGSAPLQYSKKAMGSGGDPRRVARRGEELDVLDVEPKVAVKSMVAATRE